LSRGSPRWKPLPTQHIVNPSAFLTLEPTPIVTEAGNEERKMNIDEMRAKIRALVSKLDEMKAQCKAENRSPNKSERTQAKDLIEEIEGLAMDIELEEMDIRSGGWGTHGESKRTKVFRSFSDQLRSVIEAGRPGGQINPKLYDVRAAGMSENIPLDGGFMVEQEAANKIWSYAFNQSAIMSRCDTINISKGNGIK
jgi:HK97 family phage major capsid protein